MTESRKSLFFSFSHAFDAASSGTGTCMLWIHRQASALHRAIGTDGLRTSHTSATGFPEHQQGASAIQAPLWCDMDEQMAHIQRVLSGRQRPARALTIVTLHIPKLVFTSSRDIATSVASCAAL